MAEPRHNGPSTATVDVGPSRPTWRDWLGHDAPEPTEMLSREQLIDRLRADHINVTSATIALWQRRGLLPYPTKRREGTATIGYYPNWIATLVQELRRLQGSGLKLEQIGPHLRSLARQITAPTSVTRVISAHDEGVIGASETASVPRIPASAPDSFGPLAEALARIYRHEYGTAIQKVEVRLVDDRGNPVSFTFNV